MTNIRVVAFKDTDGDNTLLVGNIVAFPNDNPKHFEWPADTAEKAKAAGQRVVDEIVELTEDGIPLFILELMGQFPFNKLCDGVTADVVLAEIGETVYFDGEVAIENYDKVQELLDAELNGEQEND